MTDSTMKATHKITSSFMPFLAYVSIITVLFSACSLLQLVNINNLEWFYFLAFMIALASGLVHLKIMHRVFENMDPEDFQNGLVITGLLLFTSLLFTGILYFIIKLDFNFLTFQLAFVAPYLINRAYVSYQRIPPEKYKLWYYPLDEAEERIDIVPPYGSKMIKFVLNKNPGTFNQKRFTLNSPKDIPLGQLFFNFIDKYNKTNPSDTIKYLNQNEEPFGWTFFIKKGLLRKKHFLDPDLSSHVEMLSSDELIYAVREEIQ